MFARHSVRSVPFTIGCACSGSALLLLVSSHRIQPVAADAAPPPSPDPPRTCSTSSSSSSKTFHGQCLERQLFRPKLPYPAWDYDWDGKMTHETDLQTLSTLEGLQESRRRSGITRHILLVRHGQYDETYTDDSRRYLTPLGRKQAELTGLRLSILARGGLGGMDDRFAGQCRLTKLHVSDMTRAKETAGIIAKHLPQSIERMKPDPLLNEGLPAPLIPARPDVTGAAQEIDEERGRIEQAFHKYFYRASNDDDNNDGEKQQNGYDEVDPSQQHEFEIIVGHGNLIRYFLMRSLQLPPEAWLRLSLFNCSITYIMIHPNGYASARSIGDTGHLSYDDTSFSGRHGYNW